MKGTRILVIKLHLGVAIGILIASGIKTTADPITEVEGDLGVNGKVGIGTSSPSSKLDVYGDTGESIAVGVTNEGASTHTGVRLLNANSAPSSYTNLIEGQQARNTIASPSALQSGDFIFGLQGALYANSAYRTNVGIYYKVDGTPGTNDYPTSISLETTQDGLSTRTQRVLIKNDGYVAIGNITPIAPLTVAVSNRPVIAVKDISTSPPGETSGYAKFFSDDGEMYVLDDDDNETQLSSHADPRDYGDSLYTSFADPQVEIPFSFHHKNRIIGKGVVVDLAAAIKDLEAITGKSYTTVYPLPESTTDELLNRYDWIEIPIEEAWELAEVEVPDPEPKFDYDLDSLDVFPIERLAGAPIQEGTTTFQRRLKADVRFDEETGKFFRRPTVAEIPQGATPDLPQWIADRLPPLE
jgi:hypothetical protein